MLFFFLAVNPIMVLLSQASGHKIEAFSSTFHLEHINWVAFLLDSS